ncbi:tyrosine-type recombinase/integrase [bacterium]|nr:tyrosine-type recombinase/integrase [bacterium]
MPKKKSNEPWLHQASGFWCKKVRGKLHYLDQDYTAAKKKLTKILREQQAGKSASSEWLDASLAQLCDEFLDDIQARKTEATYTGYRSRLTRALRSLDVQPRVSEVTKRHLSKIDRVLNSSGKYSPTTIRDTIATLQTVFSWACRNEYLTDNPIRDYEKPAARERTRIVTPNEFQSLLRGADVRFRRVLLALRLTGCRPKEVRTLIWEWVDLDSGLWILPDHKTITQQRNPRPRIIPLPAPILRLCERLNAEPQTPDDHVFLNTQGKPYSKDCFCRKFARLRRKVGIRTKAGESLVLYSNRHTFGTNAAGKVTDIELAEVMGHTDTRTTRRYVHLNHDRLRDIQRRIQDQS